MDHGELNNLVFTMFIHFSLYLLVFNIHIKLMPLFAIIRLTGVFGVRSISL